MGGFFSRAPREEILVAVIGPTDSGKSHFLSMISNGYADLETYKPTQMHYQVNIVYEGQPIRFIEFGSMRASTWNAALSQHRFNAIMWFFDEHDSLEEIYAGKNQLMDAIMPREVRLSKRDSEDTVAILPENYRLPICFVQNIGRPHPIRRTVIKEIREIRRIDAKGRDVIEEFPTFAWKENDDASVRPRVHLKDIPRVMDIDIFNQMCEGKVYLTQISHQGDVEALHFVYDWICQCK